MRVNSYAKINWALRILGKRADGFHDLETVFQTITLHDVLTFERAGRLSLTCDDPHVPCDGTNLVLRAAQALGAPPVAIHLQKRIPAGGGLGGGSSDAATTLMTLAEMFRIDAPLGDIALTLGSDVPFFLVGGTAYATGRGEVIAPLPDVSEIPLVLLMPEERVMTPEAFAAVRHYSKAHGIDAYREDLFGNAVNDFEEVIFAKLPQLARLKQQLLDRGAMWAGMSGSGSTIVGAFREAATRDAALAAFPDVRAVAAATQSADPRPLAPPA